MGATGQQQGSGYPAFLPPEVSEIEENSAHVMLRALKRVDVSVGETVVPSCFYGDLGGKEEDNTEPALVLVSHFTCASAITPTTFLPSIHLMPRHSPGPQLTSDFCFS
jgi:hypothetical protein